MTFQTESWGFDADKIVVGDTTVEDYKIPIAPGTSGMIPLAIDNSGEEAEIIQIGVTISKSKLDENGAAEMNEELQKRIFFYADTDKTYIFNEGTENETKETVSKVYIGTSAPNSYTYRILPGEKLAISDVFYNNVPLKWEWVYDMLGYYFRGTVQNAGEEMVSVDEYLRPIEYDYDFDQPVFDENGQLESLKGTKAIDFLKEIAANDGFEGTIHSSEAVSVEVEVKNGDITKKQTKIYYPVEVDETGYGVWAYLCTKEEILEGIAYDTELSKAENPVTASVTIILTANSVPTKTETVTTTTELLTALQNPNVNRVELGSDISLEQSLSFDSGNKILDLNEKEIRYSGTENAYSLIQVKNGAELTVVNGDVTGTSKATTAASIQIKAFSSQGGNLVLSGVDIVGFDTAVYVEDMNAQEDGDSVVQITNCNMESTQPTIVLQGNGDKTDVKTKVIVQNSTLNSKYYTGITGQGNIDRWGTELVVSESEISGYYSGMYLPQSDAIATIVNSKISGNTGIALKGGLMTIYDSEIIGTGAVAVADAAISQSGFVDTGDALYVEAAYDWSATLIVKGDKTKVVSEKAHAVELIGEENRGPGKVYLYDGTYSSNVVERLSAKWNQHGIFEIYGGTYKNSVSETIVRYDIKSADE